MKMMIENQIKSFLNCYTLNKFENSIINVSIKNSRRELVMHLDMKRTPTTKDLNLVKFLPFLTLHNIW